MWPSFDQSATGRAQRADPDRRPSRYKSSSVRVLFSPGMAVQGVATVQLQRTTRLEALALPVIVFDRPHWSAHTTLPAQAPVPHHYRPNRSAKVSQGSYYFCTQGFASGMLRNGAEGYQNTE